MQYFLTKNIRKYPLLLCFVLLLACSEEKRVTAPITPQASKEILRGMDLSSLPEIEASDAVYRDFNGEDVEPLSFLRVNGVNLVRLRLWHTPANDYSGFEEVKLFAERLRNLGFKICLTPHYSDSWADPGKQKTPAAWENLSFDTLKDSLYNYTKQIVQSIQPDYIQLGNEINSGVLFPMGNIQNSATQFVDLIRTASNAVRTHASTTKIILHYAGHAGADGFFDYFDQVDYDIMGISYYPIWHGKSFPQLEEGLTSLYQNHQKEILILETAYPFTLDWNDHTNNIVGLEEQLILPTYPANAQGQKAFLEKLKEMIQTTDGLIGFCYWGAELIAFDGPQSMNGSVWENQALFDFEHRALPALELFQEN